MNRMLNNTMRLMVLLALTPYAFTAEIPNPDPQDIIDEVQLIAQQVTARVDEAQAAYDAANATVVTMQNANNELQQARLLETTTELITTLHDTYVPMLLQSQVQLLENSIAQEQRLQAVATEIDTAIATIRTRQLLIQPTATPAQRQQIADMLTQLNAQKDRVKRLKRNAFVPISQGAVQVHNGLEAAHQIMQQLTPAQDAYRLANQFVARLREMQSTLQELIGLEPPLYMKALQAATVIRTSQGTLLPITPESMPEKVRLIEAAAQEVKTLVPPEEEEEEPADTQPPQGPGTQTRGTTPSGTSGTPVRMAPAGNAPAAITKINNKMRSALSKLDIAKGYYKDITPPEQALVKKKAENILKEYASDLNGFANKIRNIKNERGSQLDPDKLAPFDTFLELHTQLSAKVKSL